MEPSLRFATVSVRPDHEASRAAMFVKVGGAVVRIDATAPPALVTVALKALR